MASEQASAGDLKTALKNAIREFSYRENHETPFTLASGKKSPYYFDLKQTLLEPRFLALTGRLVAQTLSEHYKENVVAAGLTMGADPIIYAACLAAQNGSLTSESPLFRNGIIPTKILPAIVRKEAKDHGTGKKIEMLKNIDVKTPCAMIDDVITTAGSTLKAAHAMREAGFTVRHAVCVLDREEGGSETLAKEGICLLPLFRASDFRER